LRVVYPSSKEFSEVIRALSSFTDRLTLNFSEDGAYSSYLTEDKIVMVTLKVKRESFDDFALEKPVAFSFQLDDLKKALSKVKGRAGLEIAEGKEGLKFTVIEEDRGLRNTISIKAEAVQIQQVSELRVKPTFTLTLPSTYLKLVVRDAKLVSEDVRIEVQNGEFRVIAEEAGKSYYCSMTKEKPLSSIEVEAEGSSTFSSEILAKVVDAISLFDGVSVASGGGLPVKISTKLERQGELSFWVAPRL